MSDIGQNVFLRTDVATSKTRAMCGAPSVGGWIAF